MRRVIWKKFWAWDFDKEEAWLNKMAGIGLQLTGVSFPFRFEFEDGTPGEYAVRLELLDHWPSHPESAQYIRFVEDTGAEHIGSIMRWVYFRKKTDAGGFDLFSDIDSRIRHLNRILTLIGCLGPLQAVNTVNLSLRLFAGRSYLTSGDVLTFTAVLLPLTALLAMLVYGFIRLALKKRKLKKARALYE